MSTRRRGVAAALLLVVACFLGSPLVPRANATNLTRTVSVLHWAGNGISNTPSFTVSAAWYVSYDFDCSGFGTAGNFILTTDGSDTLFLANALSISGSDISFGHEAGTFFLQVNTECTFDLDVYDQTNAPLPKPRPKPLAASLKASGHPVEGSRAKLSLSATVPNGDALVSWKLAFGDKTRPTGGRLGRGLKLPSSVTHLYGHRGTYAVTLSVTDRHHKTVSGRVKVVVAAKIVYPVFTGPDALGYVYAAMSPSEKLQADFIGGAPSTVAAGPAGYSPPLNAANGEFISLLASVYGVGSDSGAGSFGYDDLRLVGQDGRVWPVDVEATTFGFEPLVEFDSLDNAAAEVSGFVYFDVPAGQSYDVLWSPDGGSRSFRVHITPS